MRAREPETGYQERGKAMTWSEEAKAAWREKRAVRRAERLARREANRVAWVRRALVRVIEEVEREAWGAAAREASDLLILLRRRAEDFPGDEPSAGLAEGGRPEGNAQGQGGGPSAGKDDP